MEAIFNRSDIVLVPKIQNKELRRTTAATSPSSISFDETGSGNLETSEVSETPGDQDDDLAVSFVNSLLENLPFGTAEISTVDFSDGQVQVGGMVDHVQRNGLRLEDVICARGSNYHKHTGNRRYLAIVKSLQKQYQAAKQKASKTKLTRLVIQKVKESGSRFVEYNRNTKSWTELGERAEREKVSHALRGGSCEARQRRKRQYQWNQSDKRSIRRLTESAAAAAHSTAPPPFFHEGRTKVVDQQEEQQVGQVESPAETKENKESPRRFHFKRQHQSIQEDTQMEQSESDERVSNGDLVVTSRPGGQANAPAGTALPVFSPVKESNTSFNSHREESVQTTGCCDDSNPVERSFQLTVEQEQATCHSWETAATVFPRRIHVLDSDDPIDDEEGDDVPLSFWRLMAKTLSFDDTHESGDTPEPFPISVSWFHQHHDDQHHDDGGAQEQPAMVSISSMTGTHFLNPIEPVNRQEQVSAEITRESGFVITFIQESWNASETQVFEDIGGSSNEGGTAVVTPPMIPTPAESSRFRTTSSGSLCWVAKELQDQKQCLDGEDKRTFRLDDSIEFWDR
ncbi:hypothetical protein ACA910_007212 [Epithemia clementina (nom. ined.)]